MCTLHRSAPILCLLSSGSINFRNFIGGRISPDLRSHTFYSRSTTSNRSCTSQLKSGNFCWDPPLCWVESKHQTLFKCDRCAVCGVTRLQRTLLFNAELFMGWVDPWVGLGRDFSVFGGLGWVHY